MAPKDSAAFERQQCHTEVGRAHDVVHPAMTLLIGSQIRSLPLGRFLLSSTGFHLILAWVIISFGLPKVPSVPRPLVVTLIESGSAEPSAPLGRLAHGQSDHKATPRQVAPSANVKTAAQPRVSPPAPALAASSPAQAVKAMEPMALDERAEPKPVGVSGAGSHAAGVAFAVGGLASGPVLLGPDGDGEAGSGPTGRGGSRQLDAALVAPLTSSVTVGSSHGAGGRGPAPTAGVTGWPGNGAAGGRFSAPNYGINPLPKYPRVAREKGYEGTVYLRVLVRADGRVEQLTVERSSGHEILDRAAADSVKEWAFFPAKKSGKPVESWVLLPVKFALN
ncbi:MAG: energy transducer TonB [candidate division NC10 bacterium]|nr:energy transducer TonB [candidate division NC10 bacterium]